MPETKDVGRPKELELLPVPLVHYLELGNAITMSQAQAAFTPYLSDHLHQPRNWGRNWHDLHKKFAQAMLDEMRRREPETAERYE